MARLRPSMNGCYCKHRSGDGARAGWAAAVARKYAERFKRGKKKP